jgi:predicted amidohydrolase YtcJ
MDPANQGRTADAVAVGGDQVMALGSEHVRAVTGPETRVIDAGGAAVIPGINDAHLHFVSAAMAAFGYLKLDRASAPDRAAVRARVERAPVGEDGWIRAHGWDDTAVGSGAGLLLDCRPDVPVVAFDSTGHQLAVNREALRRAGITATTPDPAGGVVGRSAAGEPNGLLQDGAMELLSRSLPPLPEGTLSAALLSLQQRLHGEGITSLTEPGLGPASPGLLDGAGSTAALELLGTLALEAELTLRINVLMLFAGTGGADAAAIESGLRSGLADTYASRGIDDQQLRIAGVKVFADGIPRSGTAWMSEPYGDACSHGSLVIKGRNDADKVAEMNRILALIDDAGLQAGIHATGDAATAAAVDALAGRADAVRNRHYIIHGSFSGHETLKKMAAHGIGYSTNPLIRAEAGDAMRRVLGEERFAQHQPLRSALEAGVQFNLASDAPVTSTDWRRTIVAAVRRSTRTRPGSPSDPERLTGLEALAAMTVQPAWQDKAEHFKGALIPGKAADLCLLSQPWPEDREIESLLDNAAALTLSGGRVVHDITA